MAVTPDQSARYIKQRTNRRERELDSLYESMTGDARRIVKAIVGEFCPPRIYQWGSLLDRSRFRSYSDIDIAVEGVKDVETWTRLEALAWRMTDHPLDLVRLERLEPEYADLIRQKGVMVYERPD